LAAVAARAGAADEARGGPIDCGLFLYFSAFSRVTRGMDSIRTPLRQIVPRRSVPCDLPVAVSRGSARSSQAPTAGEFWSLSLESTKARAGRVPRVLATDGVAGRAGKADGPTPAMHALGKSDRPIVPAKFPNKKAQRKPESHGEPYTGTKVETGANPNLRKWSNFQELCRASTRTGVCRRLRIEHDFRGSVFNALQSWSAPGGNAGHSQGSTYRTKGERPRGRGGDGGKGPGQGEHGRAKRAPDTVPGSRAQRARSRTRSSNKEQRECGSPRSSTTSV
jgi:hypothetical protein